MQVVCKGLGMLGITCTVEQPSVDVVQQKFADHLAEYGISYGTPEEYNYRFQIYHQNDIELNKMNADPEATFVVGHNQFSTMTEWEFKKFLGRRDTPAVTAAETLDLDESVMAATVDWRAQGKVNKVQNQGQCGSCWAFSATAVIESADAIKSGNLKKLSEQHMVDCDRRNAGCNGGMEIDALNWARTTPMGLLSDYPYVARQQTCKQVTGKVQVSQAIRVPARSVNQMKAALNQQPICVAVQAGSRAFQMYRGGILNDRNCGTRLDHAITAVGYGTENGQQYLIVRNSWGPSWGEAGHIRMAFDQDGSGICGVQLDPVRATTR